MHCPVKFQSPNNSASDKEKRSQRKRIDCIVQNTHQLKNPEERFLFGVFQLTSLFFGQGLEISYKVSEELEYIIGYPFRL